MNAAAILVAAGRGERAGLAVPKQWAPIAGKPMTLWSLEAFRRCPAIRRVVLVVPPGEEGSVAARLGDVKGVEIVAGGAARTASVRQGLAALARGERPQFVLIHDAARPGLDGDVIGRVLEALQSDAAAAPALAVADALKSADPEGRIKADVSRAGLFRIQTPQGFRFDAITQAYAAIGDDQSFDDDVAVVRAAGVEARLVAGSERLAKVTYPEDFERIALMIAPAPLCVTGTGFDAHRLGPGDHVTLCGVRTPFDRGLIGHSDADVAWHALTDALLGAVAAADIGAHFPPTDERWRGADSEVFLRHAADIVAQAGGVIVHVDLTIICERPKIKPMREAMRQRTAEALGLPLDRVSIKATTTEGMGFTGRGEGIAAQAAATVLRRY